MGWSMDPGPCFVYVPRKTSEMVFVHTTPEEVENTTITSHFGFVFEEWLSSHHRFGKIRFQNVFRPHENPSKSWRFEILRLEERFRDGSLSVDDRPNRSR